MYTAFLVRIKNLILISVSSVDQSITQVSEIMGRLKGIPDIINPDLLHALSSMGHGDL